MDLAAFKKTLLDKQPPAGITEDIQALWYDAKNNWEKAHEMVQDRTDKNASWIHAYLHRKEGDIWNADYWYHKAGKKRPSASLDEEWEQIVVALI